MKDRTIIILLISFIFISLIALSYFQYNQMKKLDYYCFSGFPPKTISFYTYADYLSFKKVYENKLLSGCKQKIKIISEGEDRFCNAGHYGCVSHDKIDYLSHGLDWDEFDEQKSMERCGVLFC